MIGLTNQSIQVQKRILQTMTYMQPANYVTYQNNDLQATNNIQQAPMEARQ